MLDSYIRVDALSVSGDHDVACSSISASASHLLPLNCSVSLSSCLFWFRKGAFPLPFVLSFFFTSTIIYKLTDAVRVLVPLKHSLSLLWAIFTKHICVSGDETKTTEISGISVVGPFSIHNTQEEQMHLYVLHSKGFFAFSFCLSLT